MLLPLEISRVPSFFEMKSKLTDQIFQLFHDMNFSEPQYIPGKVSVLVTIIIAAFLAVLLRYLVGLANAKKRAVIAGLKSSHGWDDHEVDKQRNAWAFRDLTDKQNPFFIYAS